MLPPRTTALALLLLLGACDNVDPFTRAGVWRPDGSNDANLQAMVANPDDLSAGRGATGSDGQQAAQAVERLRIDRVRVLPASGIARITPVGQAGAAPGAAGIAAPGF